MLSSHFGLTQLQTAFAQSWLKRRNVKHGLGWVLLPVFVFLLVYSLAIELPAGKTYSEPGAPNRLITTGTYALTRHPAVMWYVLALVSLVLATRSAVLLIAAPIWSVLNILYATVEDRFFFDKMFPEYEHYKQQTPMFVPTRKSLLICLRTLPKSLEFLRRSRGVDMT